MGYQITKIKERGSGYYSVFFMKWDTCTCSAGLDVVTFKSESYPTENQIETEITNYLSNHGKAQNRG